MKPNYRFNQQNQNTYVPSPWAVQGYNSASPWLDYQGGAGYRQPFNRPMPPRQRNDYMRRPMNKPQNQPNQQQYQHQRQQYQQQQHQNKRGPQKRKQNGSDKAAGAAKRKKEEEEPEGIDLVVVSSEYPPVAMTDEQLESTRSSILLEIDKLDEGDFYPQFLDSIKRRGMLVVVCNNQESVDWLKTVVENLSPWEGGRLRTMEPNDLPNYYKIQIRIPGGTEEPDKLLERLERQNEGMLTDTWHFLNQKVEKKVQMISMCVEANVIEALKKIEFKPFYNFSRIEIKRQGPMKIGRRTAKPEDKKADEESKVETTEEEAAVTEAEATEAEAAEAESAENTDDIAEGSEEVATN